MQAEEEIGFKFVLIGNSSVGKSAFLIKYADNSFSEQYVPTIGVDFKLKNLELKGKAIAMKIWDTAGQERFMNIITTYFKGANGILFFYDITNRNSFNEISKWLEQVEKYASPDVIKFLIGNKSDLNGSREVTFEEGQQWASAQGMFFTEISAKEGFNVEHAINTLLFEALAQHENKEKPEKQ